MPPLLPVSSFAIRRMVLDGTTITLEAEATTPSAPCPTCGTVSQQIHDRYDRHPADLPWRGCPVHLVRRVRRFRCGNSQCARRTFAEDFAPAVPWHAQRTADSHAFLVQVAWMMGGEAGSAGRTLSLFRGCAVSRADTRSSSLESDRSISSIV